MELQPLIRNQEVTMAHFCSPLATLPHVAQPSADHPQITFPGAIHKSARTFLLGPVDSHPDEAPPSDAPQSLTLIFDEADHARPTQLYIDRLPVPSRFWTWDHHRGVLSWRFADPDAPARGRMAFSLGGTHAVGSVEKAGTHLGVVGQLAPVSYDCDLALNAGASVGGSDQSPQLSWDATSAQWRNATWVGKALEFTYQLDKQIIVGQPVYSIDVTFDDEQTSMEWQPSQATARMAAGLRFDMTTPGDDMPTDDRSGLSDPNARAITTVFPYQLSFNLTNFGNNINGAMLTANSTTAGTVVAFRGKPHNPSVVGLYRIDGKQARAAFAVHDRKLWIHDEPIDDSRLAGNALRFSGLSPAQQAVSGLPAEGTLVFSDDGHTHRLEGCDIVGRRASADAVAAPCASREAVAHPMVTASANLVGDSDLSLTELANMTQFAFVQDPVSHNNVWVDAVQQATMNDFNQILLYYMS